MENVQYMHLRIADENDELKATGGATVAFIVEEDKISYAFAICSPKDNYRKRDGRALAYTRLQAKVSLYNVVLRETFFNAMGINQISDRTPMTYLSHHVIREFFFNDMAYIANY